MKSYWIANGELELRDIAEPQVAPGQVRVRVRAAGLNRGEFTASHGAKTPKPCGGEAAGDVLEVGAGVTRFKPGDRVMGRANGCFAEQVLIDDREVLAIPERLSWEEAAGVPLTFMVTTDMLFAQGGLKPGDWLLVLGASSGVGVACLQAARANGARVIGTSGSQEKLDRLTALGLDVAIHTRAPDFQQRVMEATDGKGANVVVNAVGGSVFAEGVRSLAFQGRLAMVGYVDGILETPLDLELLHRMRLVLFGVSNRMRTPAQKAETVPVFVEKVLPALVDGRIRPVVDHVFAFDQLVQAKAMMESNGHLGKIVLRGA